MWMEQLSRKASKAGRTGINEGQEGDTASKMEKEAGLGLGPGGKSAGELIVLYERKEGNWITLQRRRGRKHTYMLQ